MKIGSTQSEPPTMCSSGSLPTIVLQLHPHLGTKVISTVVGNVLGLSDNESAPIHIKSESKLKFK